MAAMSASVTYHPETQTFTHFGGDQWRQVYPIARLQERLAFYRRMREEHPKSGNRYDADIVALAALVQQLGLES